MDIKVVQPFPLQILGQEKIVKQGEEAITRISL